MPSPDKEVMRGVRVSASTAVTLNSAARDIGIKPAQLDSQILTFVAELMRDERRQGEPFGYFFHRVLSKGK